MCGFTIVVTNQKTWVYDSVCWVHKIGSWGIFNTETPEVVYSWLTVAAPNASSTTIFFQWSPSEEPTITYLPRASNKVFPHHSRKSVMPLSPPHTTTAAAALQVLHFHSRKPYDLLSYSSTSRTTNATACIFKGTWYTCVSLAARALISIITDHHWAAAAAAGRQEETQKQQIQHCWALPTWGWQADKPPSPRGTVSSKQAWCGVACACDDVKVKPATAFNAPAHKILVTRSTKPGSAPKSAPQT